MEHRKRAAVDSLPWTQIGIKERRYYKLLPQFARKINGRYEADRDVVVAQMRKHLDAQDHARSVRADATEVLRDHGFGEAAARKWLQRHGPAEAIDAWPRGTRRP